MPPILQQFLSAFLKYRKDGFFKGGELILTRGAALSLIDDIVHLGFACWGATGWYSPAIHPEWLAEDLDAEFNVPNSVLDGLDAVQFSADLTKTFIESGMQERDTFVNIYFDHPEEWWKVIKQAWEMTEGPTSALHLPPLSGLMVGDGN